MIWLWITAALVLSYLPLFNKKIDIPYYMWLLIPIDAYGISVAGAVLKPYMVFALILPLILYAKNKGTDFDLSASKGQLLAGVLSVLIVLVNMLNTDDVSSVKAAIMTMVVYICAQIYASSTNCEHSEQLSDVFIASSFGCGMVYLIAYLCLQGGLDIGGITASNRAQNGLFLLMSNMSHGDFIQVYRLRGFSFDPNTMFVQFIFSSTACVSRLFKKFNIYYIITLVISLFSILLSSSRMGLLCFVFTIALTALINITRFDSVKKKIISTVTVLGVCAGALVFLISKYGQSILSSILSTYTNRSSLTDEYGRFSIWKECFKVYWDKSPFLGVGLGQMNKYTLTERMTHNTWLQFICECGLIVGSIAVIYFLSVMFIGWRKTRLKHKNEPDNTSYLCLIIGYTATIISLLSADNITCSYLWFSALLVLKMASYTTPTKSSQSNTLSSHTDN